MEEVHYLSARNTQLEEDTTAVPRLRQEVIANRKQIEVLLLLVGEKEEEIEAVIGDLKEVKALYQDQIRELTDRLVKVEAHPVSHLQELITTNGSDGDGFNGSGGVGVEGVEEKKTATGMSTGMSTGSMGNTQQDTSSSLRPPVKDKSRLD